VPLVLMRDDKEGDFRYGFPIVYAYVQQRYAIAVPTSDLIEGYQVLVDRRLSPASIYEPLGLPCFR
jgi:hypothetical protein